MAGWTSVVSWHLDPETCGVARFNVQLAAHLRVPCVGLRARAAQGHRPLYSLKWAEVRTAVRAEDVAAWWDAAVLWHDAPPWPLAPRWRRLDQLGVPALTRGAPLDDRALFTFGMAHKLEAQWFGVLRAALGPSRPQLWVSTATHEGAGPSRVAEVLAVWGPSARNLGTLSDDALQLIWPRALALVAFFAGGLRPNNTTVHAALDAGVPVITNHGPDTPADLRALTTDVTALVRLPDPPAGPSPYTWARLLQEVACVS